MLSDGPRPECSGSLGLPPDSAGVSVCPCPWPGVWHTPVTCLKRWGSCSLGSCWKGPSWPHWAGYRDGTLMGSETGAQRGRRSKLRAEASWPSSPHQPQGLWKHLSCFLRPRLILWRYNWHTALYKFKPYSIVTWRISQNDYHDKFSEHPSSQIDTELRRLKKIFFSCDENF